MAILFQDDFESLSSSFNVGGDFAVVLDPAQARTGSGVLRLFYRTGIHVAVPARSVTFSGNVITSNSGPWDNIPSPGVNIQIKQTVSNNTTSNQEGRHVTAATSTTITVQETLIAETANAWIHQQRTGPGFRTTSFPAQGTIYARWYERYSTGWLWSTVAQKIIKLQTSGPSAGPQMVWITGTGTVAGAPQLGIEFEDIAQSAFFQNGTPVSFSDKWKCIEVYHKQDTGAGDGEIRLWMDDVLKMERLGLHYHNSFQPFTIFMLSAFYNSSNTYPEGVPQDQTRWIDDLVISMERIGCAGTPPPDTTPPTVPQLGTITAIRRV